MNRQIIPIEESYQIIGNYRNDVSAYNAVCYLIREGKIEEFIPEEVLVKSEGKLISIGNAPLQSRYIYMDSILEYKNGNKNNPGTRVRATKEGKTTTYKSIRCFCSENKIKVTQGHVSFMLRKNKTIKIEGFTLERL